MEQQALKQGRAPHMLDTAQDSFAESTNDRVELERQRPGTSGSYGASSGGILSR